MEQPLVLVLTPYNYLKWKFEMNKLLRVKMLYSIVHGLDGEQKEMKLKRKSG